MDIITRNFLLLKLAEVFGVIAVLMIAGTSKHMIFRPVDFKYPKREGRISTGLFVILFLVSYFFYTLGVDINLFPDKILNGLGNQLALGLICLGITAAVLFYRRQPLLSAGWGRKQNTRLGLRIGILLIFLTIFLRGKIGTIIDGVSAQEGIALALLLGISLAEEIIFRGYLQLRFSSWVGKYGWLLTAALFVLWRLPFLMLDSTGLWLNLALLIVQSVLLGWIMKRTGHVLASGLFRAVSDWLTILV